MVTDLFFLKHRFFFLEGEDAYIIFKSPKFWRNEPMCGLHTLAEKTTDCWVQWECDFEKQNWDK